MEYVDVYWVFEVMMVLLYEFIFAPFTIAPFTPFEWIDVWHVEKTNLMAEVDVWHRLRNEIK